MATQPVLGGTTLPWPSAHAPTSGYRGGVLIMADGTQVTDLVQANAKKGVTLSWTAISASDLGTILTGAATIKDTSASYTDIDNATFNVTGDGIVEVAASSVDGSAGSNIRYNVTLKLREA